MDDVHQKAGIREGQIKVDGLTIRYLEAGSGTPY